MKKKEKRKKCSRDNRVKVREKESFSSFPQLLRRSLPESYPKDFVLPLLKKKRGWFFESNEPDLIVSISRFLPLRGNAMIGNSAIFQRNKPVASV